MKTPALFSLIRYLIKTRRPATPSNDVKPPDKCLLSLLFNVIVCGIVVAYSGTVYATDSDDPTGYAASVQDEQIISCYAQYAYNSYLTSPAFKHMGDCDRRFSPNNQIPFNYLGSQDVSGNYNADTDKHYRDTSIDWYTRIKPAENGHPVKKQLLIAFRGTKQIRDDLSDIRTEGEFWRMWSAPDASPHQLANKYREQYFNLGLTGAFHHALWKDLEKASQEYGYVGNIIEQDNGIDTNEIFIENTWYRQRQPRFAKGFWQRALANSSDVIYQVKQLQKWQAHQDDGGDIEVIVTGHSLGAATATITGLWLMDRFESCKTGASTGVSFCNGYDNGKQKVEVFAYNPPKTGNKKMQELTEFILHKYDESYRMHLFINSIDIVSRIPGESQLSMWPSEWFTYDVVAGGLYLFHLEEPGYHVINPKLEHGKTTTVLGEKNAYVPVFVGKAPVNVSDGVDNWQKMNHHYDWPDGSYNNFPKFNTGDFYHHDVLYAHSPQQWITSGWNDYSVPNYRAHLDPNLKAKDLGSNLVQAKKGRVSFFNDHSPALQQKTLVEGRKYRFQKADELDKCLAVDRHTYSTPRHVITSCSTAGPMNILFTATAGDSGYMNLAVQHSREISNLCLGTNDQTTSLTECQAHNHVSYDWKLKWDARYGVSGLLYPNAVSLQSSDNNCLGNNDALSMEHCPTAEHMGNWIVTEAPKFDGALSNFTLASVYSKSVLDWNVDCLKHSGSTLKRDGSGDCDNPDWVGHQVPMAMKSASDSQDLHSIRSGVSLFTYKKLSVPVARKNVQWVKDDDSTTTNFFARWFDDSYQLQLGDDNYHGHHGVKRGMVVPNKDYRANGYNTDDTVPGKVNSHVFTDLIGVKEFYGDKIPDWWKVKPTQFHIKRGKNGNVNSTRRMEANDDANLATVEFGESVLLNVLENDIHIHHAPIEIVSVSASHGAASVTTDGHILYQAPNNFLGSATITYTISDGLSGESGIIDVDDTAVATVNVWENVSLNKPATQSSNWGTHPASLAVDGYLNNYTHTTLESEAWWKVSLEGVHRVKEVNVFNRTDCCKDRLKDFKIILHHANGDLTRFNPNKGYDEERVEDVYSFKFGEDAFTDIVAVTVQLEGTNYLSLADVQVLGEKLGPLPPVSKQTNPSSDGGGDMAYLDQHQLSCGARGISQFQLKRQGADEIYYGYECSQTASNELSGTYQSTTFSSDGGGDTRYLDRHALNCNNRPIHAFELKRNNEHDEVRYRYLCGSQKLFNVKTYNTPWDVFSEKSWYLDRHNVECPSNQVLSFVRLKTQWGNNRMRYKFKCGSPFE